MHSCTTCLTIKFACEVLNVVSARLHLLFSMFLILTCCSGCSVLIRGSGTTLENLDSRVAVEKQFGPSENIEQVDLVDPSTQEVHEFEVEKYHVHWKFNSHFPMGAYSLWWLAWEPILTCHAMYNVAKEVVTGHDLAFIYDEAGNTIGHQYPRPWLTATSDRKTNVLKWEEVARDRNDVD